jgi:hypothetical protein
MARKTNKLDLQAELPKVLSTDFNLFYRPEEAPVDKSVEQFTKSLDAFVNSAGIGLVVSAEKKEKEMNEAEAIKAFNENRTSFNKAVESGSIPKEANPYFIEKYKELELNKKAEEFKTLLYTRYAENNVLENPDPQAFDKFYNDQLKLFVAENNLGIYDPVKLEKGFFSQTSGTRNQLFQTHVNSQMAKIGEDYKISFKENIQSKFDKNKTFEETGADITAFMKDAVDNGLSKSTAQKYLLESLADYAETTADLEYAERLLRDLPNHIKPGTDAIGNIKGLQNDFDAIKEKIDDRILQRDKDELTKLSNASTLETFEANNFADEFDTYSEAIQDPRFQEFSRSKKDKIFKEFESREVGFDTQTDPRVDDNINELLRASNYEGALELLNKEIPNVTGGYYSKKKQEIQSFKFTEKDGLLAGELYIFFKNKVEATAKSINQGKFNTTGISNIEHEKFEANIRQWLLDNPLSEFGGKLTAREDAFNTYVKKKYNEFKDKALTGDITFADGEITVNEEIEVNPEDLE